ncbi:MAG: PQQ-binding-like beta-propeller repeat protein [Oligoflexales bacterium]|nr:PQQ-binding-like beta-propeller repeat protein [Oligoflexales bacterium]
MQLHLKRRSISKQSILLFLILLFSYLLFSAPAFSQNYKKISFDSLVRLENRVESIPGLAFAYDDFDMPMSLLTGDVKGRVKAYDPNTNKLIWQSKLKSGINAIATIGKGKNTQIVVAGANGLASLLNKQGKEIANFFPDSFQDTIITISVTENREYGGKKIIFGTVNGALTICSLPPTTPCRFVKLFDFPIDHLAIDPGTGDIYGSSLDKIFRFNYLSPAKGSEIIKSLSSQDWAYDLSNIAYNFKHRVITLAHGNSLKILSLDDGKTLFNFTLQDPLIRINQIINLSQGDLIMTVGESDERKLSISIYNLTNGQVHLPQPISLGLDNLQISSRLLLSEDQGFAAITSMSVAGYILSFGSPRSQLYLGRTSELGFFK